METVEPRVERPPRCLPAGPMTLADLYDRYAEGLYGYARLLCRSPDEAEDTVHDCFLRANGSLERIAGVDDPKAYLFAMLRNEVARRGVWWSRKRKRDLEGGILRFRLAEGESPADTPDPERVERAMRSLPDEQRETVFLKIWEEMTFEGIARTLGIPANTAASRYRYGLAKLKEALGGTS